MVVFSLFRGWKVLEVLLKMPGVVFRVLNGPSATRACEEEVGACQNTTETQLGFDILASVGVQLQSAVPPVTRSIASHHPWTSSRSVFDLGYQVPRALEMRCGAPQTV